MSLVQKVKANNGTAASASVALTGVAAGDLLSFILVTNTAITVNSEADSTGDAVQTAVAYAANTAGLAIYYVQALTAGTHTFTANFSGTSGAELYAAEYSGNWVLDVVSPVASGTGSTTIVTGSITPTANGDLILFGCAAQGTSTTFSALTNGFVQEDLNNPAAPASFWADLTQTTAAAITGGATDSNSAAHWVAALAAFKSATAPVAYLPSTRLQWFGEDTATAF
jgi:hypothetical protein